MKIRDKLRGVGVPVPDEAHSYRTGKGCLMWMPATAGDGTAAMCFVSVTAAQYEAMMVAGLAGPCGWNFDDPYVEPADRSLPAPRPMRR